MKRYKFTRLMHKYLDAEASLTEEIRFEKWIRREPKRRIRFERMLETRKFISPMFPSIIERLDKVNASRIHRGLPPV